MYLKDTTLYYAIKEVLESLIDQGLRGYDLESLLRMQVEDVIQAVMTDADPIAGIEKPTIQVGGRILDRDETVDMLTNGIKHPGGLSIKKIIEGLVLQLKTTLDDTFKIDAAPEQSTITILMEGSEVAHIFVDEHRVHIFHGVNVVPTDLKSIQQMSAIFPTVYEFVVMMEEVVGTKTPSKNNPSEPGGNSGPSFDWI